MRRIPKKPQWVFITKRSDLMLFEKFAGLF